MVSIKQPLAPYSVNPPMRWLGLKDQWSIGTRNVLDRQTANVIRQPANEAHCGNRNWNPRRMPYYVGIPEVDIQRDHMSEELWVSHASLEQSVFELLFTVCRFMRIHLKLLEFYFLNKYTNLNRLIMGPVKLLILTFSFRIKI